MSGFLENETSEMNRPETGPDFNMAEMDLLRNLESVSSLVILVYDPAAGTCCYAGKDGPGHPEPEEACLRRIFHEEDLPAVRAYLDTFASGGNMTAGALYCLFHKPGATNWTQGALKTSVFKKRENKTPLLLLVVEQERFSTDDVAPADNEKQELGLVAERMMHFGTYNWNLEDDQLTWSAGLYQMFGCKPTDLPQLSYDAYIRYVLPEDREHLRAAVADALKNGNEPDVEYRIQTTSGEVKTVSTMLRVVRNTLDMPVRIIGTTKDITPIRSAEEQLARHVDELSRSNKELEEFAYVASHDLQEPLRKISTFTDRIVGKYSELLDDDGRLYLKRIIASTQNMRLLIDNLLEFSRITRQPNTYVSTNLGTVVSEVRRDLDLTIEETGAKLHIAKLPVIEAIPGQMKQLFNNLLSNAFKFRKENVAPDITIDTAVLADEEKVKYGLLPDIIYHRITITDNGIGFEEEYATRIFQIFQRLHGKSEYPGTGIGLAICKKITEHHKGIIFAENIPGQGARFTVILPEQQKYAGIA